VRNIGIAASRIIPWVKVLHGRVESRVYLAPSRGIQAVVSVRRWDQEVQQYSRWVPKIRTEGQLTPPNQKASRTDTPSRQTSSFFAERLQHCDCFDDHLILHLRSSVCCVKGSGPRLSRFLLNRHHHLPAFGLKLALLVPHSYLSSAIWAKHCVDFCGCGATICHVFFRGLFTGFETPTILKYII